MLGRRLARSFAQNMAPTTRTRTLASSAPRRGDADVAPGYTADSNAPPMLRFEKSLPHLPVPSLASTASKYLETVKPHLSPSAFQNTQSAVSEFVKSDLAKELQSRLEARAAEPGRDSWLAEWWDSVAYNAYRDPVVVFVSYFYVHLDDPRMRGLPARRAAHLLKATTAFRKLVEEGSLSPEMVKKTPLAMSSYKWMFHSSRYPVKSEDTAKKFDPATHNHVAVLRKNKFFILPLAHSDGTDLSAAELESQLNKIIEAAGTQKAPAVGALTSENRDVWADARQALLDAGSENARLLEQVESAAVVLCLDDTKPVTREQISWGTWTGDGRNRFYDKHQIIVYDNGRSGFLGEHSCMDGTPTLRWNQFTLASLAAGRIDLGPSTVRPDLAPPTELTFTLNDKVRTYIAEAESHFDELVAKHDLHVLHYEGYGKDTIKKYKASPDAWVQLLKQLAFQKMYGRPGVTYESAQTRKYKLGRTEVIRSASNESKAWAEAMVDPDRSDAERAALFRKAVTRHIQYAAWSADGQGVDRHLFGLKRMLREGEPLPAIYKDEAFAKTSHWELSTSQLSSPFIDGWGYGEVVPDGYGLSYAIGDDHIRWTITSLKRDTEVLKHYLAEAATETRAMMERAAALEPEQGKAKL